MRSCVETAESFIADHPDVEDTPEAALLVAIACSLDDPANSATSKSMMAGRFLETIEVLRSMSPEKAEVSPLDEIRQRREAKLRGSDAKNRVDAAR